MINLGNKRLFRKTVVVGIVTIMVLSVVGCANTNSEVVARINDEVITKDDLYNVLVAKGGEEQLDTLIYEIIINAEAKKAKIEISAEDIQAELDGMIESYGGEDTFNEVLEYYGYDMEEMEKNIEMNLKIKRLLEPNLEISDEEINEYFEKNKEEFKIEEQVMAKHILVEEENEADDIYQRLENGENFEELAMEYSIDGSAETGGDLGYFGRNEMVKEFEDVAFSLKIDEISKPVKSGYGYHIIKLIDKIESEDPKLDDYEEIIKDRILEENLSDLYEDWYNEIVEDYKIEKTLSN